MKHSNLSLTYTNINIDLAPFIARFNSHFKTETFARSHLNFFPPNIVNVSNLLPNFMRCLNHIHLHVSGAIFLQSSTVVSICSRFYRLFLQR
jgi:hypothetical protein